MEDVVAVGKQDRLASLSCRVKAHQRVHQYTGTLPVFLPKSRRASVTISQFHCPDWAVLTGWWGP